MVLRMQLTMSVGKNKILLFLKLPPPITGATLMNKYVAESKLLRNNFKIHTIAISYNSSVSQMGSYSFAKFFKIIKYNSTLIKELIKFKPDLIYFQISPLGFAFLRDSLFVFTMKLFRKKIVFHLHGKGISQQLNNPMKKLLYKFVFKNQDIITLSELLDYDIKDVFKGRIFHVPNGISKVDYNDNEKPINKVPKILYLSNLIKSKGILDFLDSLEILAHKNIDFNVSIVGEEADLTKQELNLLIDKKNISKSVMYLGSKYEKEKNTFFLQSDIFVFPTKNDIFGLVNIEAMKFGLPVVSTNEGAISEIIDDGITGFIVDKNSPGLIADKIEFLINNPKKRIEMGKAGREKFLNNYTIDIFEKNMKNVFEKILKRS